VSKTQSSQQPSIEELGRIKLSYELRNAREMEIIMLGLKINYVHYPHIQPRMHGAAGKIRRIALFETLNV